MGNFHSIHPLIHIFSTFHFTDFQPLIKYFKNKLSFLIIVTKIVIHLYHTNTKKNKMKTEKEEYWGKGKYIGEEFVEEFGSDIEIGNDDENDTYKIKFEDGSEFDNIFEHEIEFY